MLFIGKIWAFTFESYLGSSWIQINKFCYLHGVGFIRTIWWSIALRAFTTECWHDFVGCFSPFGPTLFMSSCGGWLPFEETQMSIRLVLSAMLMGVPRGVAVATDIGPYIWNEFNFWNMRYFWFSYSLEHLYRVDDHDRQAHLLMQIIDNSGSTRILCERWCSDKVRPKFGGKRDDNKCLFLLKKYKYFFPLTSLYNEYLNDNPTVLLLENWSDDLDNNVLLHRPFYFLLSEWSKGKWDWESIE